MRTTVRVAILRLFDLRAGKATNPCRGDLQERRQEARMAIRIFQIKRADEEARILQRQGSPASLERELEVKIQSRSGGFLTRKRASAGSAPDLHIQPLLLEAEA